MKVINRETKEVYAEVMTNHDMTIEEALQIAGYERSDGGADYIYSDGTEVYIEDCEITMKTYWIETSYNNEEVWALHCAEDEDDEIVLSKPYADFENGLENVDRQSPEYLDTVWDRIDAYIEEELGFMPDYGVN